jgi:hypothetical protein
VRKNLKIQTAHNILAQRKNDSWNRNVADYYDEDESVVDQKIITQ